LRCMHASLSPLVRMQFLWSSRFASSRLDEREEPSSISRTRQCRRQTIYTQDWVLREQHCTLLLDQELKKMRMRNENHCFSSHEMERELNCEKKHKLQHKFAARLMVHDLSSFCIWKEREDGKSGRK
jgi:hypothetical protein